MRTLCCFIFLSGVVLFAQVYPPTMQVSGNAAPSPNGSATAAYLGQVATRSFPPNWNSGAKQAMLRTVHFARSPIGQLKVCEANWYLAAGAETGSGAGLTVKASLEYPLGTNVGGFTWSSAVTASVATGTTSCSDFLTATIPDGAPFAIRRYLTSTSSIPMIYQTGLANNSLGDAAWYGASGITDLTSGTGTTSFSNDANVFSSPTLILANTTRRSILLLGDSKQFGYKDTSDNITGDIGETGRAMGPFMAYTNAGVPGETLAQFVATHTLKLSLLPYFTDIAINYGINDATGGQSITQYESNASVVIPLLTGKRVYWTTLAPYTDSGNATVSNTTRVQFNQFLLNSGMGGFLPIDLRRIVENGMTGLWTLSSYTADGVHETPAGNIAIRDSGVLQHVILQR